MTATYTLHQKREQLRWHSARHGPSNAVRAAAEFASSLGLAVMEETVTDVAAQLEAKYGAHPENVYIGFFESDGMVHPAIAAVAHSTATETSATIRPSSYLSSHLGMMQVSHTHSPERGFTIMYQARLSEQSTLSLIFSGPPNTGGALAEASHSLVNDFALSTVQIGARP